MIKQTLYSLLFSLVLNISHPAVVNSTTPSFTGSKSSCDFSLDPYPLHFSLTTPPEKYDSILLLGSKEKRKLLKRVDGALEEIIFPYSVQKIIVSGGCTKYCRQRKMKTEAEEMFQRLAQRGIPEENITLEERAMTTEQNYLHTRGDFRKGERVIVISDEKHAKAVAYCLRYKEGLDAFYYILGKSRFPEIPSARIPGSRDDYYGLARKCKRIKSI